ncbi:N-acetylmuramic acid 6-phosphate etherase [Candidatus Woesearchaeota archaeon]|nr:N-acetylmuramic acid 6-phosphate etherase [Candidatus Woesearchaeota archaeon]
MVPMKTVTEYRNKKSENIHEKDTKGILSIINEEDCGVAFSVKKELGKIAEAADVIAEAFKNCGRLFFIGAGTSGRLGIIQAAECPPTFGTSPEMVQGIIAGGKESVFSAKEGAEDSEEDGYESVKELLTSQDVLVGVSASGTTPFVIGGLRAAKDKGCKTVSVSCNKNMAISKLADVSIDIVVGPEVLTGSTRMKSGTAQKMVLDMLTTTAMIRIGRVSNNLMTNLKPISQKLKERAARIVVELTSLKGLPGAEALKKAEAVLKKNGYDIDKSVSVIKSS